MTPEGNYPVRPKPLIAVAVFCDRVLREVDGTHSLVRIVDTYTVGPIPPNVPGRPVIELNGFLLFKSGDAKGKYEVRLTLTSPSGTSTQLGDPQYIVLEGGVHGAAVTIHLTLDVKEMGGFSLDVFVDGERLTRLPFRLRGPETQNADQSTS